uniref:Uncharacterized protein n=1 Tax=Rubinisphaera brasiliensis (strain ATCC 49424 / DSM 5305 / JCM 21570 / IAM 15109 / NBRC 103401 / IFAM 1448) TaxID=756272 RepID=F0SJT9_RUBBR|nr:hypothetical protein Plabr_4354 [Rubinisphaera brasiliensis DSM 5305]
MPQMARIWFGTGRITESGLEIADSRVMAGAFDCFKLGLSVTLLGILVAACRCCGRIFLRRQVLPHAVRFRNAQQYRRPAVTLARKSAGPFRLIVLSTNS